MKMLRRFRMLFAVLFFAAISLQFFDIYHNLPDFYLENSPARVQFMPSLLKFFAGFGLASAWAFLAFAGMALIVGRAYCSFICPLGILMDILRKLAKFPAESSLLKKTALGKFCAKKFPNLRYSRGLTALRFSFFALAAAFIALGLGGLLGLIDPYSLYGKIMGGAFITTSSAANFAGAKLAEMGYYGMPAAGRAAASLPAFGFSIFLLVLFAALSAKKGRLFCNTLCPVGAALGGLAKFSLFRLGLDKASCVSCGKCERACKAMCVNSRQKTLDFSRCVLCFNCAAGCPKSSIRFSLNPIYKKIFFKEAEKSGGESITRREFMAVSALAAAAGCGFSKADEELAQMHSLKVLEGASEYRIAGGRADKRLPSPPGSKSVENFLSRCTACQRCVSACKSQVLKASITQWGLKGFMQPFMDFKSGFCLPYCNDCSKVCPTGAIGFIDPQEKMGEKIGTAIFNRELCVVFTDGTDCAACAEHCPVQAIEMIPFNEKKSLYIPHVHEDVCIGCGACENVCPVRPHTAIVIQGRKIHTRAAPFSENMRLYVPQKENAPKSAPEPLENPFPF